MFITWIEHDWPVILQLILNLHRLSSFTKDVHLELVEAHPSVHLVLFSLVVDWELEVDAREFK